MCKCILCDSKMVEPFFEKVDKHLGERKYIKCNCCQLVFLLPEYFFDSHQEKKRYDLHQNDPSDEDYVYFLKRLAGPVLMKINIDDHGLDYGCGPGPTLSKIFQEKGIRVENYDPIYFNDTDKLNQTYDFITCSEVVEHFYNPREEFLKFDKLIKEQGGILGIMTQFRKDGYEFKDWWYHREPTHVCFYHQKTFQWIANWRNWQVEFPAPNIVIFEK